MCTQIKAIQRIGPHNQDILSAFVGNLLGDGWAEKRYGAIRMHIHMSHRNQQYVYWLHAFYASRNYCSSAFPKKKIQIGKKSKAYISIKFRTWSFTSLCWLYDAFYAAGKKKIPSNIACLLTPMAFAFWVMDDGAKAEGLRLHTEGYTYEDILRLQHACEQNFHVRPTIQKRKNMYWMLYFTKAQKKILGPIIAPYMHPSMMYKILVP